MKELEKKLKENILFFWVDEMEFNFLDWWLKENCFFEFEENLDDDNSNFAYLEIEDFWIKFYYSKIYPKWYKRGLKFSTIINDNIVDCFALLKWREGKVISSKDKVVFYSSFFVIENLGLLKFSLYDFMLLFWEPQLCRLDIALDVPFSIESINKDIFKNVNFFAQIWRDIKNPFFSQTYYINNPRSDRNRKYIFRIYDKLLDTFKKKKAFLYPHLQNRENVRRIEVEIRAEECKRFIDYDVYDILQNKNNCINKIFSNYFNKHSEIKLKDDFIFLKAYENKEKDFFDCAFFSTYQVPIDYLSRAHWYLDTIIKNTSYNGLFDVLTKNIKINPTSNETTLKLFELYLFYMKKRWIYKSEVKKLFKKYFY